MKKIMFLITIILLISNVSAFMPRATHKWIQQASLENPINSNLYTNCVKYPALCYSGNVLNDISVYFYYTQKNKYSATHSPSFCRALLQNAENEQEDACAVGGCMHQPQDIVPHNEMVPYAIKHTWLVNNIIHVFSEQKLDNYVEKKYPGIREEAINYLSDYETCMPLFKRTLLGEAEYSDMTEEEVDTVFAGFISEIMNSQTGYDTSFKNKSFFVNLKAIPLPILAIYILIMLGFTIICVLLVFKIIFHTTKIRFYIALLIFLPITIIMIWLFIGASQGSAFNNFITVIKPISNLVPIGDKDYYLNKAVSNTKEMLTQGEQWLFDTEASGFTALGEADYGVLYYDYAIFIVLILVFILYIWYLFKRVKGGRR